MSITTPLRRFFVERAGRSRATQHAGGSCWCIGLPDGRGVDVLTDRIEVTAHGVLLLWADSRPPTKPVPEGDPRRREPCDPWCTLALPSGAWTHVYAASALDGAPLAVDTVPAPRA